MKQVQQKYIKQKKKNYKTQEKQILLKNILTQTTKKTNEKYTHNRIVGLYRLV